MWKCVAFGKCENVEMCLKEMFAVIAHSWGRC